jgi:hypothetical protein
MLRQLLVFLPVALVVAGCASTPPRPAERMGLNGLGQSKKPQHGQHRLTVTAPAQPDPNREKEKVLATFREYSAEWVALHKEIEAEEDRRLKAKLVICRGCLPKEDADRTGSLGQRETGDAVRKPSGL